MYRGLVSLLPVPSCMLKKRRAQHHDVVILAMISCGCGVAAE